MKLKVRNPRGWVVMADNGMIDQSSFSNTRREAIDRFLHGGGMTWAQCRKYGWTAVRVKIHFELITPATAPEKEIEQ